MLRNVDMGYMPRHPRHNGPAQHQHLDSIGLGKITENQMKAVVDLVKERGALNNQPPPEDAEGNGIVIAAGGKYDAYGYVNARWLRTQGIQHPIQIWYLGTKEYPPHTHKAFAKLDVELVDAFKVREKHWHRSLKSWFLKQYACMYAPFRNVVFYDADCFANCDPSVVWDDADYQEKGALFFSDVKPCRNSDWPYIFASVRIPDNEMESGVFFWDRVKAWSGIRMSVWMGEHNEVWCKMLHGEKDIPYLGFGATGTPFIQSDERSWEGYGIEQRWKGRIIAKHCMGSKRGEHIFPHPVIPGFFDEWRSLIS